MKLEMDDYEPKHCPEKTDPHKSLLVVFYVFKAGVATRRKGNQSQGANFVDAKARNVQTPTPI